MSSQRNVRNIFLSNQDDIPLCGFKPKFMLMGNLNGGDLRELIVIDDYCDIKILKNSMTYECSDLKNNFPIISVVLYNFLHIAKDSILTLDICGNLSVFEFDKFNEDLKTAHCFLLVRHRSKCNAKSFVPMKHSSGARLVFISIGHNIHTLCFDMISNEFQEIECYNMSHSVISMDVLNNTYLLLGSDIGTISVYCYIWDVPAKQTTILRFDDDQSNSNNVIQANAVDDINAVSQYILTRRSQAYGGEVRAPDGYGPSHSHSHSHTHAHGHTHSHSATTPHYSLSHALSHSHSHAHTTSHVHSLSADTASSPSPSSLSLFSGFGRSNSMIRNTVITSFSVRLLRKEVKVQRNCEPPLPYLLDSSGIRVTIKAFTDELHSALYNQVHNPIPQTTIIGSFAAVWMDGRVCICQITLNNIARNISSDTLSSGSDSINPSADISQSHFATESLHEWKVIQYVYSKYSFFSISFVPFLTENLVDWNYDSSSIPNHDANQKRHFPSKHFLVATSWCGRSLFISINPEVVTQNVTWQIDLMEDKIAHAHEESISVTRPSPSELVLCHESHTLIKACCVEMCSSAPAGGNTISNTSSNGFKLYSLKASEKSISVVAGKERDLVDAGLPQCNRYTLTAIDTANVEVVVDRWEKMNPIFSMPSSLDLDGNDDEVKYIKNKKKEWLIRRLIKMSKEDLQNLSSYTQSLL